MIEKNIIFKKFANSFINEILPLIKKNHIKLTKEFQDETSEDIAYLFKCKYYSIITPETYRIAINHVILQDVKDITSWLSDNGLFVCQCDVDIDDACFNVINSFPEQIALYRNGNANVLNFIVGQVMKHARGKFRADVLKDRLRILISQNQICR